MDELKITGLDEIRIHW